MATCPALACSTMAERAILVVEGDPAVQAQLGAALGDHAVQTVSDPADALALLAKTKFDLILCEFQLPGGNGLELLQRCASDHPDMPRILVTAYDELPEIVRARSRFNMRVVQRSAKPEQLRRIVSEVFGERPAPAKPRFAAEQLEELLRWSARGLAAVPSVVLRPLPHPERMRLEFVLRTGDALEALRAEIVSHWLWPLKARDGELPARDRHHPVVALFGELAPNQELYVRRLDGEEEVYAYLALLPWRHEPRVTAVLGIQRPHFLELPWQLLVDVHRMALSEMGELPLPSLPSASEHTGTAQPALEYDWIVTRTYVGPERRKTPTPLLSRYLLFGRRRRVPSKITRLSDNFVDQIALFVRWYALAYFLLSTVDTVLTLWAVRRGLVREANPLLRPLVLHAPWLFLVVKNAIALAAFFLVARFQLFHIGRWLLSATVGAYLALDIYWVLILAGVF